ncbi:hypothetical protein AB0M46_13770 [Dactylosporangium sp. NPDC051485]|uniref:hypothetical protein n=1 Tax=Dactylosporangium sp. NPDC051485 TaxID=3154846 RepID=UPI00342A329A
MTTHDLLSQAAAKALPAHVSAQLVDLGDACNRAYIAVVEAEAIGLSATNTLETTGLDPRGPVYTIRWAEREHDSARALLAARTTNYTDLAIVYAAAACSVLAAVAYGREPAVFDLAATTDQLLGDLDAYVPLVRLDTSTAINPAWVDDVTAELRQAHDKVRRAATSVPMAGRRTGHGSISPDTTPSQNLGSGVPVAFHAYAAGAVSALTTIIEDRAGRGGGP